MTSRDENAPVRRGGVALYVRSLVSLGAVEPQDDAVLLLASDALAVPGWLLVRHVALMPGDGIAHGRGCVCCVGPQGLPAALLSLFQQRARGDVPFFASVVVAVREEEVAAISAMLKQDIFVSAYFVCKKET